jgi:hypothetical protein
VRTGWHLVGGSVALNPDTGHTSTMTLKSAATLAMIGTLLLTILVAVDFINAVLSVVRGLIPAMGLSSSLIYLFDSLTVTLFFWAFNGGQDG